jgi:hypothetical protein
MDATRCRLRHYPAKASAFYTQRYIEETRSGHHIASICTYYMVFCTYVSIPISLAISQVQRSPSQFEIIKQHIMARNQAVEALRVISLAALQVFHVF